MIINYFSKGRLFSNNSYAHYSQNSSAIFYFAIYINIVVLYGMYIFMYNALFLFSSNWWISASAVICAVSSTLLSFIYNYN